MALLLLCLTKVAAQNVSWYLQPFSFSGNRNELHLLNQHALSDSIAVIDRIMHFENPFCSRSPGCQKYLVYV